MDSLLNSPSTSSGLQAAKSTIAVKSSSIDNATKNPKNPITVKALRSKFASLLLILAPKDSKLIMGTLSERRGPTPMDGVEIAHLMEEIDRTNRILCSKLSLCSLLTLRVCNVKRRTQMLPVNRWNGVLTSLLENMMLK